MTDIEPKKRKLFGRLFGKDDAAASVAPVREDERPAALALSPQPEPAQPPVSASAPQTAGEPAKTGWFQRLRQGLTKTSTQLTEGITGVFAKRKLDFETLDAFEEVLVRADLGVQIAGRIVEKLSLGRFDNGPSPEAVSSILADEVEATLRPVAIPLVVDGSKRPHVILVVGVNGTGKTTTIGKLARVFTGEGKRVMLAAGDTFRAAAIEQLKIWGERTNSPVVSGETGADAAGLVHDALRRAVEAGSDILIVDTAGRLQNKAYLMAELEKIVRVIGKFDPTAPHTVLLTLDATTGQNALSQVEIFKKTAGVTGLIMTKLDGTARGGILVAIADKYKIPVHAIGVGEGVDDLQPFDAREFARAIAGL